MKRAVFCAVLFLAVCIVASAQDAAYYKAIQKGAATQIEPKQFKQMEEDALRDYAQPSRYELLASSFANTTERVWAVIYGEVFCNLSSDSDRNSKMGTLIFQSYEKSLSSQGGNLSVDLTENAQVLQKQAPFESQFEMSFLMGAIPLGNSVAPLSIEKLAKIRENQLSLWAQKKLPLNELLRRQQAISAAGHFEAYNYWLFQSARPDEFNEWVSQHQAQFKGWQDWQNKNKFTLKSADFQRLRVMRGW
jgi:hypothetical protein